MRTKYGGHLRGSGAISAVCRTSQNPTGQLYASVYNHREEHRFVTRLGFVAAIPF